MFKRRSGNFVGDLTWQGWLMFLGGAEIFVAFMLLVGLFPNPILADGSQSFPITTTAAGMIMGIVLCILGFWKRNA